MNSIEQLKKELEEKLEERYSLVVLKKETGLKRLFGYYREDALRVKKNAYHGLLLTIVEKETGTKQKGACIRVDAYTPSMWVDQVLGRSARLDRWIAGLVFGSGRGFYRHWQEIMTQGLKANVVVADAES